MNLNFPYLLDQLEVHSNLSLGFLLDSVLLEWSHEGSLVCWGLETTMSKLGGGVDELKVDLLKGSTLGVDQQRLKQNT